MKKSLVVAVMALIICLAVTNGYADTVLPFSSNVFKSADISVSSTGTVTFSVEAKKICESISVTSCSLDRLDQGKWVFVTSLSVPSAKLNTFRYSASKDYSSSLQHGNTYRFRVTFSAGGEILTRTSSAMNY